MCVIFLHRTSSIEVHRKPVHTATIDHPDYPKFSSYPDLQLKQIYLIFFLLFFAKSPQQNAPNTHQKVAPHSCWQVLRESKPINITGGTTFIVSIRYSQRLPSLKLGLEDELRCEITNKIPLFEIIEIQHPIKDDLRFDIQIGNGKSTICGEFSV